MLTTIIKTKNSENTISEVLESVKDLGEIIVVDEHSSDDTILIAKEYKARIVYLNISDFKETFNQTISEAQNDWILLIEGDEIVPEKLGNAVLNYIEKAKKNVISCPKKQFYKDIEIKAARKFEIKVFKKGFAHLVNNNSIELKPKKTKIHKIFKNFKVNKNCILKFEKRDIFSMFKDNIEKIILKSKESKNSSHIFLKPCLKFFYLYIIKGAILQGKVGYIYSTIEMFKEFIMECAKFEKTQDEST